MWTLEQVPPSSPGRAGPGMDGPLVGHYLSSLCLQRTCRDGAPQPSPLSAQVASKCPSCRSCQQWCRSGVQ
eukprot:231392-Rhodomonas_salina.2